MLALPRLHVITDERALALADWPALAEAVLAAGGERVALHVRGRSLDGRVLHDHVRALEAPARAAGAMLVVNDRVDVAMTTRADGVQLTEASLPVAEARELLGPMRWIGASVHGAERASRADEEGADYLVVGTLFATPSHPDRPGRGTALLDETLRASSLPQVAIGGITTGRVAEVVASGAHGVAVLSGVWGAPDVATAVTAYLDALGERPVVEVE
jgi:thiamine-phosphate diphosphorylase